MSKTTTKAQLKLEQRAMKELKKSFEQARNRVEDKIDLLNARKDLQNIQSIVHQKKYQEIILKQIDSVITDLNVHQYTTLDYFFQGSYNMGYTSMMYDLIQQDIPIIVPIDPKKMVTAVMTDSKLSKEYYQNRVLPENLSVLKRKIRTELTTGIASGKTWLEMAYQLAHGMNSPFNKAQSDAMRIIRTEGHRINQQGFLDAGDEAKEKGADIVKQWDATLDGITRPWHQEADGQIVEWDEYFTVGGEKMKAPSIGGSARNVCNCRCQLLQRAKWALDDKELQELKDRANFFGIDKSDSFDEFQKKYLKLPKNADTVEVSVKEKFRTMSADVKSLEMKVENLKIQHRKYERDVIVSADLDAFEKAKKVKAEIDKYTDDIANMKSELENLMNDFNFDLNDAIINLKHYSNFDSDDLIELAKTASHISSADKRILWNDSTGYIQTGNSFSINRYLRTGDVNRLYNVNKSLQTIDVLEEVINNNYCSKNGILYRYVDADFLEHFNLLTDFDVLHRYDPAKKEALVNEFNMMCSNEIDVFKSFTSTSYDNSKNVFTNRCVKLNIHVPDGANMYMTDNDYESEVILNRDSAFKIYGAKLENNVFNIYLELIK